MNHSPLTLVCWMVAAMSVVAGGLFLEWSSMFIVWVGIGLLSAAYIITRNACNRSHEYAERIRTSLCELQQVSKPSLDRVLLPSEPESVCSELQHVVADIRSRVANLKEERENIAAIVENLVEGVVSFDPLGHVLFSNPSACRFLGLDKSQLNGRSVWEVIRHKELAELVERCRHLALHDHEHLEVVIHAPIPMALEVYGLPFPLANQKNGSVMVLHDVTQLRRLEQVRTEFIDNVSHEIRTPLAAIIGYLETLIDEPSLETPNNRKFVQVAHQHAERLNRLVDDLRSLSEIESGKVRLKCEALALKNVVDEVSDMFESHIQNKHLHLVNHIDEDVRVWSDKDRVVQIFLNLIDNAIKYSFEGGSITFQVERRDEAIVVQVTDTGQGIPSTDLPRITERFYRVDRARSRAEGGTGLGLSIVKHLVQLLDGQLHISSEVGKGTRIEIELPAPSQNNILAAST